MDKIQIRQLKLHEHFTIKIMYYINEKLNA